MAKARRFDGEEAAEDPYMVQFDKGVALAGYGLLFVSPFMVGLPAMASLALAFAHRHEAHPLTRTHYRFQSRIFWTAAALLILALVSLLAGGGMAVTTVLGFVQDRLGVALPGWLVGGYANAGERATGDGLMVGGLVCAAIAIGWLMLGSLWGFFKLVLGRPIGQTR